MQQECAVAELDAVVGSKVQLEHNLSSFTGFAVAVEVLYLFMEVK